MLPATCSSQLVAGGHNGVHPKLVALIQDLYQGTTTRVRANGYLSDTIPIHSGVRQGCPLSPTLFNVYMDFVRPKVRSDAAGQGCVVPSHLLLPVDEAGPGCT